MTTAVKAAYWLLCSQRAAREKTKRSEKLKELVVEILANDAVVDVAEAELAFPVLRREYAGPPEYGYGDRPNWLRGVERSRQLICYCPSFEPRSRTLEVACGDGMTSVCLKSFGADVTLTDLADWRDSRARSLPFFAVDLTHATALPAAEVDLVFSYNAFEHFPDPARALELMLASLRPGGHLFVEFGPLYAGPWGLHAYRMLPMPFPQFLFSENFWQDRLRESGGVKDLGQDLGDLQPMNRWTVTQFEALFAGAGCDVLLMERISAQDHLDLVVRFPSSFQGRGLTLDDLTTHGLRVLLKKPVVT